MARKRTTPRDGLILVRATVNMHGLRAGKLAWVDPNEQFVKDGLEATFLVEEQPVAGEEPPEPEDDG